jgi:Inner membrane component of T3SS, cytoplasmic domain/Domain of unknown function (DUF4389)
MVDGAFQLEWLHSSGTVKSSPIGEGTITIGRSSTCDVILEDDPQVSGLHARLTLAGNQVRIDDAGSTNGILVGGEKVSTATLAVGQEWTLGTTRMRVSARPQAQDPAATAAVAAVPAAAAAPAGEPAPAEPPSLLEAREEAPSQGEDDFVYPIRFWMDYPEQLNRLLNFPLFIGTAIKAILLIPHFLVLLILGIAALFVAVLIAPFGILFTGNYPRGMFNFVTGYLRWGYRVNAYFLSLTDRYPPFSLSPKDNGQAHFEADYPDGLLRWLNLPLGIGILVKYLWAYPMIFIAGIGLMLTYFLIFLAQFAILFTGRFPLRLYRFAETPLRLAAGVYAYILAMTDSYPYADVTPRRNW